MPICSGCKQEKLVTLKATGLCNECIYATRDQRLASELDGFLRMAVTGLSASFHGVHKGVPREQAIRRGQELGLLLWDVLVPLKADASGEEWASLKVDAVAYLANMLAHNHDLLDDQLIVDAIECAKLKWKMHLAWRQQQS